MVQLRLGIVGCAAGVLSAFDESDRPRLREPRPSNMLGSQEWRALSSVPQGGAGSLQSLSSSRRRVMASCLCWRAPCSSPLQTAKRAPVPDSAQSPWNRSRERTFENQWCRSPGRVGGCAVRIWFEPLVTEQVFCPYKMTLPRTGFRPIVCTQHPRAHSGATTEWSRRAESLGGVFNRDFPI